jgi:NADH:ubiquinone oxidoreductase subunit 2 (subunit N)
VTKTLAQRLDAIAELTPIPAIAMHPPRRRPMRRLPIATLVLATAGLVVLLTGGRTYWAGQGLVTIAFAVSCWMPAFGPIKAWMTSSERIDEHDEMIRKNAYLAALPAILGFAFVAVSGLPLLAILAGWPASRLSIAGSTCGLYLLVLWTSIPTLHASWKWRADDQD